MTWQHRADPSAVDVARGMIDRLTGLALIAVADQVIGELCNVLMTTGTGRGDARDVILTVGPDCKGCPIIRDR